MFCKIGVLTSDLNVSIKMKFKSENYEERKKKKIL